MPRTKSKKKLTFEEQLRAEAAQEELARRQSAKTLDVLQEALPYQLDFIKHPSLRKCVCSERRGGKSFALALAQVDQCLRVPGSKCIYISLTNESCKQVMWSDIFETIFLKYNIQAVLTSKHEIEFANGSVIFLRGMDATPHQMHRARGQAFDLAVIDEAQDFTQDLKQIIHSVLKMTLAQRKACLIMAGTPGNKQGLHYWWQINKPESTENEWTRFAFHWKENTKVDPKSNMRVCDAIQEMVDADIARNPKIVETPEFKQEILGLWVIETSARIYRYEPEVNDIYQLPSPAYLKSARYILSFDIGYSPDPSTLIISCYNTHYDENYYVIQAETHPQMLTADLAKRIKMLDAEYKFQLIVGDSANLNIVSDLALTYGVPTTKADKPGKFAHQNMLNSDFITGNIKIYVPGCPGLSEQLQTVIWDNHGLLLGKHIEDPKYHNDLTDALLYGHFASRHHWYKAPKPKPAPLTNQQKYQELTNQLLKRNKPSGLFGVADFSEPNR